MEKKIAVLHARDELAKTTPLEPQQLVGFLASLPAILSSHGVDPQEVLASAGLSAHSLDNPEDSIPYSNMIDLLALAVQKAATPHLGLQIGQALRIAHLGVIGELMRSAPTLRGALQDLAANQHHYAPGCAVYLIENKESGKAFFGTAAYQPGLRRNLILWDSLAMAAVTLIRELAGSRDDAVLEVLLSRNEPQDVVPYRQAFAVDLRFNAEQTAAVLDATRLDQPLSSADPGLHGAALARARALGHASELDIVSRLRRFLRVALLRGKVSANQISVQLGMSRRTLHRRLDAEGVHYQEILDETRCGFAQQLLADTTLRIGEIATIVGYTDPSALTRRFIRWTGVPPNEWRSNLKSGV